MAEKDSTPKYSKTGTVQGEAEKGKVLLSQGTKSKDGVLAAMCRTLSPGKSKKT